MKLASLSLALALSLSSASAAYTYLYTDNFTQQTNYWVPNGSPTFLAGLHGTSTGSSLIGAVGWMPVGPAYEIKSQFVPSFSTSYVHYVRASSNALHGATPSGSYYASILSNLKSSGSTCLFDLSIVSRISNTVTVLGSWSQAIGVPCSATVDYRTIMKADGRFVVFVNGLCYHVSTPVTLSSGMPGVGLQSSNPNAGISTTSMGPGDSTAPTGPTSVSSTVWSNAVDFQLGGAVDDQNGAGLWQYWVYRNGTFVGGLKTTGGWRDTTIVPGSTYTYQFFAVDFHVNTSAGQTVQVVAPPQGTIDERRTGIVPNGSYWGGPGENIDLQSGNVNFAVPLVKATGRGSAAIDLSLTYDSQVWRKDPGGVWLLGEDVGYGFGWRMRIGSITPVYSDWWTLDHYEYSDGSGAEYRLQPDSSGQYWINVKDGLFITYDPATSKVWLNDGTSLLMTSTSAPGESDAGSRYPTLIQDSNGNQVKVRYQAGKGGGVNSSARITEIEDARTPQNDTKTYTFTYNTDTTPHLTAISNTIGTGEVYSITYTNSAALSSPFSPQVSFGTTTLLSSVVITNANMNYTFGYGTNNSGELASVTHPYGGRYEYELYDVTYSNNKTFREIVRRRLISNPGTSANTYTFYYAPDDGARQYHQWRSILDANQDADKVWFFNTDTTSVYAGLVSTYYERVIPSYQALLYKEYNWCTTSQTGRPYTCSESTTLDDGKRSRTDQSRDDYGNTLNTWVYGYDSSTTPVRTYSNTYLADQTYTNKFIRNRLLTTTVSAGTITRVLRQNAYDSYSSLSTDCGAGFSNGIKDAAGIRQHDAAIGINTTARGNLTKSDVLGKGRYCAAYDIGGNVTTASDPNGVQVTASSIVAATNFTVPTTITPNADQTLATTSQFTSFLAPTQVVTPNGITTTATYDLMARPSTVQSPFGNVTHYAYAGATRTTTDDAVPGRYTKDTYDGFGRTISTEIGNGSTVHSITESVYAPCACSPLGKLSAVSLPRAPGATAYWTAYTYDARGRTTAVSAPNGAGTTSYSYVGNSVTVTNPAGKWKKYTLDAFGNIVKVEEPNPSGANTLVTTYTYNFLSQLTQVQMTRGATTQLRTFGYDSAQRLISVTQPESGTTTFTYTGNGARLYTKTDARGKSIRYDWDTFGRLGSMTVVGDAAPMMLVSYTDATSTTGQTMAGRLASVVINAGEDGNIVERYGYHPTGAVAWKRVEASGTSVQVNYTWDQMGNVASIKYPDDYVDNGWPPTATTGMTLNVTYDSLHRPMHLQNQTLGRYVVYGATYNAANQITGFQGLAAMSGTATYSAVFQYNVLGQLTRETVPGEADLEYRFSATANDGRVSQRKDWITGEEVTYQYDALGRLTSAATTGPEWGLTWAYDGFGNRTQQTLTKGAGPSISMAVDVGTNRLTGTGVQYDASGNLLSDGLRTFTYDAVGRVTTAQGEKYVYGLRNERLFLKRTAQQDNQKEIYLYGLDGKLLCAHKVIYIASSNMMVSVRLPEKERIYFAGRLVMLGGQKAVTDRLGSLVRHGSTSYRYYPYGEEIGGATGNDKVKFATYSRDSATGLDYAMNRYFTSGWGRFISPDQYGASASAAVPDSWNRYSYVQGDPTNWGDPSGLNMGMLIPGFCEAEFASCSGSDGGGGDNGGGGGGGGWSIPCGWLYGNVCTIMSGAPTVTGGTGGDDSAVTYECEVSVTSQPAFHLGIPGEPQHTAIVMKEKVRYVSSTYSTTQVIDGGPTPVWVAFKVGNRLTRRVPAWELDGGITPKGRYNTAASSSASVEWTSGWSGANCDYVTRILSAWAGVNEGRYMYLGLASNSNTYVKTIMRDAGIPVNPGYGDFEGWSGELVAFPAGAIITPR